jgi:hypothetical protein
MGLYDWLLFFHVLAAFMTVASVAIFGGLLTVEAGHPVARLSNLAGWLWNIGGLSVLVLGIWLAINRDEYDVFDGWIITAIVLWVIASAAGGRITAGYARGDAVARSTAIFGVMAVAVLALLVVMIFKPGA